MKIRSITTGFHLDVPTPYRRLKRYADFTKKAKQDFIRNGYEVQTIRLTTQPWNRCFKNMSWRELRTIISSIEQSCQDTGVDFINLGTVELPYMIQGIPSLIAYTSRVSLSATIASRKRGVLKESIKEAARVIKTISHNTENGYGNFRFAAIANCPPHIPFFPASYHAGKPCFSIALECSDLVVQACKTGAGLDNTSHMLHNIMTRELRKIEHIAQRVAQRYGVRFQGIDTSPAPSLRRKESLVTSFERLLKQPFGAPGTLSIARMITRVLKSIPVKQCGYCGLMLPVLEDYGLAHAFSNGTIMLDRLLLLSSVCGTGLDCVPLPGSMSVKALHAILQDVATLAVTLNKPLSARLFPVPGKTAGERTDFQSPYMMDCRIPDVFGASRVKELT